MERMWRKVTLAGRSKTGQSSDNGGFDEAVETGTTSMTVKSLSQHVLSGHHTKTSHETRKARTRRKSRPRRRTQISCVGDGGDNMSSSGGFYTLNDPNARKLINAAPSGTILMYPNAAVNTQAKIANSEAGAMSQDVTTHTNTGTDITLRQRIAKLRMFNFNLNWDLHMTHCKPCGPRITGGGNIITRRLYRSRRRDDNELYRSNSFRFERFVRNELNEELSDEMKKQIALCDDYSLPVDFVKKRPSSFDPNLVDHLESATPQEEVNHKVKFVDQPQKLSTSIVQLSTLSNLPPLSGSTLRKFQPISSVKDSSQEQNSLHQRPSKAKSPKGGIRHASVRLIEGYSDPKDSRRHNKKGFHQKSRKRHDKAVKIKKHRPKKDLKTAETKRRTYNSDSSAPKSSDDDVDNDHDDDVGLKVPELNSPDSISDDLIHPLSQPQRLSPKKVTVGLSNEHCKRNPSPYYYSDLLKSKDSAVDKDIRQGCRQSTISESLAVAQIISTITEGEHKSNSCDTPEREEIVEPKSAVKFCNEDIGSDAVNVHLQVVDTQKRYSFTEDGVHIIRCDSPSTSTSEESDCSECEKRREWHARALAVVRKTCNIEPLDCLTAQDDPCSKNILDEVTSMPSNGKVERAICACISSAIKDDIDEYFRPRSIFYIHNHNGEIELDAPCIDSNTASNTGDLLNATGEHLHSSDSLKLVDDVMSGRIRQIYETAFDCKIAKSDDDLDDVDRITNHSVLLQANTTSNSNTTETRYLSKSASAQSRLEGKHLKNSKNHALQEQASNSGNNPGTQNENVHADANGSLVNCMSTITSNLENITICEDDVAQRNILPSSSQLSIRGYTPSPPSTAPLPLKFPSSKNDLFFINSIKSAPNLPSNHPAHPRLKDLQLSIQNPVHSHLHHHQTVAENSCSENNQVGKLHRHHHGRSRNRPRSFVLESGRILELRKAHSKSARRRHENNYSSTESIVTSSSGSMDSLRSSTSEGNRSTSSSESRHSISLSSHSSESGSSSAPFALRAPVAVHSKLHILSPISDKSSQEQNSEVSEQNKTQNASAEEDVQACQPTNNEFLRPMLTQQLDVARKRRVPANKTLLHLTDEVIGSDSGISLHSREDGKLTTCLQQSIIQNKLKQPILPTEQSSLELKSANRLVLPKELHELPFDMPKLRRRKTPQQDFCTSGSATSVDLGELPFDMPKLRRRLRANQSDITTLILKSTESSGISQASSSHSIVRENNKRCIQLDPAIFRQNLTLNLNETRHNNKFGSLDTRGLSAAKELNLNFSIPNTSAVDLIDVSIPLERQGWYHGAITRIDAETTLRPLSEGSFLVRNCESTKQDYSLSLKGAKGFMHMRIQRNDVGQFVLGQFSRPFESVPEMIRHFCLNRLPVRGAEHMCLIDPVIAQFL